MWKDDFNGYNPELATLKKFFPEQEWIVFTDYNDDDLKQMRNELHLNDAKIEDKRE